MSTTSRTVLCAVDLGWQDGAGGGQQPLITPLARTVLSAAVREAAHDDAELVILHALPMDPGAPMSPQAAEAVLLQREEIVNIVIDAIIDAIQVIGRPNGSAPEDIPILVEDGPAARAILDAAQRLGAELIVVGNIGANRLGDALLGRVTASVVRDAPCSVLVVRAPDAQRAPA